MVVDFSNKQATQATVSESNSLINPSPVAPSSPKLSGASISTADNQFSDIKSYQKDLADKKKDEAQNTELSNEINKLRNSKGPSGATELIKIAANNILNTDICIQALKAICSRGDIELTDQLKDLLKDSRCSEDVKLSVNFTLAHFGDKKAIEYVTEILKKDSKLSNLEADFLNLGLNSSKELFANILSSDCPAVICIKTARRFMEIDKEAAKPYMINCLNSHDDILMYAVLSAFEGDRSPLAAKAYVKALSNPNRFLRGVIASTRIAREFKNIQDFSLMLYNAANDPNTPLEEAKFYKKYAQSIDQCQKLNIEYPFRFDPVELQYIVEARLKPDPNTKRVIAVQAKADYNSSFSQNNEIFREFGKQGYQVIYYEAGNRQEFLRALSEGSGQNTDMSKPASVIFIGAHGEKEGIELGYEKIGYISTKDIERLRLDNPEIFKQALAAGGNIILDACSTGKTDKNRGETKEENFASIMRRVFPQAEQSGIFSPTEKGYIDSFEVRSGKITQVIYKFSDQINDPKIIPTFQSVLPDFPVT